MEGLPREMILHILEFCPPPEYGRFLQATRLVHPVDEAQRKRKKIEKMCTLSKFYHGYCYWIVKEVLAALFSNDELDAQEIEDWDVIGDALYQFLLDFSKDRPDVVGKYYRAWLQQKGSGYRFPTREDAQLFVAHSVMTSCYDDGFNDVLQCMLKYPGAESSLTHLFSEK